MSWDYGTFSSSVKTFFKRACAAIQWGYMFDFWSDPLSTSILHLCEQQRLWWDCAGSPEPSWAYVISTIISRAGYNIKVSFCLIMTVGSVEQVSLNICLIDLRFYCTINTIQVMSSQSTYFKSFYFHMFFIWWIYSWRFIRGNFYLQCIMLSYVHSIYAHIKR